MPSRRRAPATLAACLAGAAAALVASCSRSSSDPVEALLAEMEAAAEARDADRLGALLSAEFRLPDGLGKAVAVAEAKRYFVLYETVALNVHSVSIERADGRARVRCVIEFSGRAKTLPGIEGLLPPEEAYRFDLGVVHEDAGWRFRSAAWE